MEFEAARRWSERPNFGDVAVCLPLRRLGVFTKSPTGPMASSLRAGKCFKFQYSLPVLRHCGWMRKVWSFTRLPRLSCESGVAHHFLLDFEGDGLENGYLGSH